MATLLTEPRSFAPPLPEPKLTSYRHWEKYANPDLLIVKGKIDDVIRDRARQGGLFEPPEPDAPALVSTLPPLLSADSLTPTNDLGAVLSPSQVKRYLNCPASWWFRYGCGLADPARASLVRGRVIHQVAEHWFKAKLDGTVLEVDDLAMPFDHAWETEAVKAIWMHDEKPAELKQKAAVLLRKYIEEAAWEITPAAMETPIAGEIGGVKVRGFIDLIDVDGRIIDLKTAAKKPSGIAPDYALQLATYAQLEPRASGDVRLDTLVATKTPQLVTLPYRVSVDDRTMTERLYPMVQASIREGLYLPNRGSNLCSRKSCNFWRECQEQYGGTVKGDAE